jgi:hypothetical protein
MKPAVSPDMTDVRARMVAKMNSGSNVRPHMPKLAAPWSGPMTHWTRGTSAQAQALTMPEPYFPIPAYSSAEPPSSPGVLDVENGNLQRASDDPIDGLAGRIDEDDAIVVAAKTPTGSLQKDLPETMLSPAAGV